MIKITKRVMTNTNRVSICHNFFIILVTILLLSFYFCISSTFVFKSAEIKYQFSYFLESLSTRSKLSTSEDIKFIIYSSVSHIVNYIPVFYWGIQDKLWVTVHVCVGKLHFFHFTCLISHFL